MSLKWLRTGSEDMAQIIEWNRANSPGELAELTQKIWDAAQSLRIFPQRGRTGRVLGTRELAVAELPYILVYVIEDSANISIIRLLHHHQKG